MTRALPARLRNTLTCVLLLWGVPVLVAGETATVISSYENAPTPVRHAVDRLSDYIGIPVSKAEGNQRSVRIELNSSTNPRIGIQGYTIRSANGIVTISANDSEGATNGIYTLLRTLMIEHRRDPLSREWNVEEKPAFSIRAIRVAPYRYGASYGFAKLSPDRWSFEDWKQYVDFMRLCNMTTLIMGSTRMYDPDYPDSWREKWRYEVWKQVMDYCHQLGMKFDWFMMPYLVPEQAFWDNPDKRYINPHGAWYGNGLDWSKGKDIILKSQRYTLSYFRGMDDLILMYSDGGSFFFDKPGGSGDPLAGFTDVTKSYLQLLREVGNNARFIYKNWGLQFWIDLSMPKSILEKYPQYKTLQDDSMARLPKNTVWEDASMLTFIQNFGDWIEASGNPPVRENLLVGKKYGFPTIIDKYWYMNPESAINMFPHPYIRRSIQEARYAQNEIGADGAEGYRLAPPMRFLCDYAYFRVISDPSLTQEKLVDEMAGLLTDRREDEATVKEAINTLEQFWSTRKLEDVEKADRLFRNVLPNEHSKNLEYVSNGVTFLTYIVRMAQPGVTPQQKNNLKKELYQTVKPMYIMQGLTSDIVWIPEAVRFFNARVDMMVQDYGYPLYSPRPDVVDRSIYPKATSDPVRLHWPEGMHPQPGPSPHERSHQDGEKNQ